MGSSLFKKAWILHLVILISWPFSGKAAPGESVSLDAYLSRIRESISLVESSDGKLPKPQGRLLRHQFPLHLVVSKGERETFHVDNEVLHGWIQGAEDSPSGRRQLLIHLKTLSVQLAPERGVLPSEELFRNKGRQTLEDVYNRDEFRRLKATSTAPWKLFLAELFQKVMEWLEEHAGILEGKALNWISYAVYGLLILSGLVAMIWIFRSTDRPGWRWRSPKVDEADRQEKGDAPPAASWADIRAEADRKAQGGELRLAVRLFFVSVLLEGQNKGWWDYRPERTNTEHLAFIGEPAQRRDALRRLTDLYERTWYGVKEPDPHELAACREWQRRMEAA